jgi:isopentenyl phosphate kinase
MVRPIVVKFGGSVITQKDRPFSLRRRVLYRLARELRASPSPVALVHGGGSFAHPLARKYRRDLVAGFFKIHQAMERLNSEVMLALAKARIQAFSLPPSSFIQVRGGEIAKSEYQLPRDSLDLRGRKQLDLARGSAPNRPAPRGSPFSPSQPRQSGGRTKLSSQGRAF